MPATPQRASAPAFPLTSPHRHQLVPPRCGATRKFLPLHVPRLRADSLGGGEYLSLAEARVEGVHGGVQARLLGWRRSVEEVGLVRRAGLFEAEEHDARLAVARPRHVERVHLLADGAEHLVRRVRGRGENDRAPQKIASSARAKAARLANAEALKLYFFVGGYISKKTRKAKWGSGAIDALSNQLQVELPGLRGFSPTSMKKMRLFFEA